MLKIYQGRENIDKEKFIYEHTEGETLVIVPDQYTLVAEEQALKYLNTSCLLNVEILSMNRLGLRMLQEQGTDNVRMLDRYERYMLLARIIRNREKQLDIFRTSAGKRNFVEMVHEKNWRKFWRIRKPTNCCGRKSGSSPAFWRSTNPWCRESTRMWRITWTCTRTPSGNPGNWREKRCGSTDSTA